MPSVHSKLYPDCSSRMRMMTNQMMVKHQLLKQQVEPLGVEEEVFEPQHQEEQMDKEEDESEHLTDEQVMLDSMIAGILKRTKRKLLSLNEFSDEQRKTIGSDWDSKVVHRCLEIKQRVNNKSKKDGKCRMGKCNSRICSRAWCGINGFYIGVWCATCIQEFARKYPDVDYIHDPKVQLPKKGRGALRL